MLQFHYICKDNGEHILQKHRKFYSEKLFHYILYLSCKKAYTQKIERGDTIPRLFVIRLSDFDEYYENKCHIT